MTKIACFSDTHNEHNKVIVPECDILLFAGDFSNSGRPGEVKSFLDWLSVQPAKNIVYIAGNHDESYEKSPKFKELMIKLYPNLHYLEDSGINLCGLNIYGSPFTPEFCNWSFMLGPKAIRKKWALIPENTDILVTHGPPYGILDTVSFDGTQAGCIDLLEAVLKIKPRLHIFGHLHENFGQVKTNDTLFVNAAIVDDRYDAVNQPIIIEI